MTILFFFILLLMLMLALAFVLVPLWSGREGVRPAKLTGVMVLVALSIVAMGIYWKVGNSQALLHYWVLRKEAKAVHAQLAKIKNPMQIVDELKAHLRSHPNSPRGWYLLGQLELGIHYYSKAYHALAIAHHLQPRNDLYSVSYAQAAFFSHGRHLTPKMEQLLKGVITRHPNNVAAINLLAINAYLEHRYQIAVNYWERLIPLFPMGSQDSRMLLTMIARAQHQLNQHPNGDLKEKSNDRSNQ